LKKADEKEISFQERKRLRSIKQDAKQRIRQKEEVFHLVGIIKSRNERVKQLLDILSCSLPEEMKDNILRQFE